MVTIKKKDLKKYKPKQEIDELVDGDGAPIEGGENHVNDTEIWVAPQQTSDDLAALAIQPSRFYFGADGSPYSHGSRVGSQKEGEEIDGEEISEEIIDEVAKERMRKMVEDIVNKKLDVGMVNRPINPDVNRNNIPDIEELSTQKPTAATHTQIFIHDIKKVPLSPDEIGIILNYILSNLNLNDISNDYKRILRDKI